MDLWHVVVWGNTHKKSISGRGIFEKIVQPSCSSPNCLLLYDGNTKSIEISSSWWLKYSHHSKKTDYIKKRLSLWKRSSARVPGSHAINMYCRWFLARMKQQYNTAVISSFTSFIIERTICIIFRGTVAASRLLSRGSKLTKSERIRTRYLQIKTSEVNKLFSSNLLYPLFIFHSDRSSEKYTKNFPKIICSP